MKEQQIVRDVQNILITSENGNLWVKAYTEYAKSILKNKEKYNENRGLFRLHFPFYAYSSIGKAKRNSKASIYDLRVCGHSVGTISAKVNKLKEREVHLSVSKRKINTIKKYFLPIDDKRLDNLVEKCGDKKGGIKIDWVKDSANRERFLKLFLNNNFASKKLFSEEHRIENLLLSEFSNKKCKKIIGNIQPIKLGHSFFQLTTPISASNHQPTFSMSKNGASGGGIDILARISHKKNNRDSRIAVIELKDENNSTEPAKDVMFQALSYATFIAYLLKYREDLGEKWWKIFKHNKGSKLPAEIIIDVVILMPKGNLEEGSLDSINIPEIHATLKPYTLYYEIDKNRLISGFSGTLYDELSKVFL